MGWGWVFLWMAGLGGGDEGRGGRGGEVVTSGNVSIYGIYAL